MFLNASEFNEGATPSVATSEADPIVNILVRALLALLCALISGLIRRSKYTGLTTRTRTSRPGPKATQSSPRRLLPAHMFPSVFSSGTEEWLTTSSPDRRSLSLLGAHDHPRRAPRAAPDQVMGTVTLMRLSRRWRRTWPRLQQWWHARMRLCGRRKAEGP
eukprot:SAG11_NODE_11437_length_761_cov_0.716012_2_plen_161_part_00